MAAIAGAGLSLGIFNTIQASVRNRVRLQVLPKSAFQIAPNAWRRSLEAYEPGAGFCIEVVNLSAFAVTIDEIGFTNKGKEVRSACPRPVLLDDGVWPRRIEPHESVAA